MSVRKRRNTSHRFLMAWLRAPLKMGAFVPSSRALARAMAAQLDLEAPGTIIELGAGTGVVTHALLDAGVKPPRLLVIEREPALHAILCAHFPDVTVLHADARDLTGVIERENSKCVNAVVSSLPLLAMPAPIRHAIEQQMLLAVGEGGIIVQFTYGTRSPLRLSEMRKHGMTGRRVKTVLVNVPPAHVWVYRKAE